MTDQELSIYKKSSGNDYRYDNSKYVDNSFPIRARPKIFWTRKKLLSLGLIIVCLLVALSVSLSAVFLHRNAIQPNGRGPVNPPSSGGNNNGTLWQPKVGATWNYQIDGALPANYSGKYDVWDIDLFENTPETIAAIQKQGSHIICYFSGGSYEEWRPDAGNFSNSDLGKPLDGWPGENWLNVSSPNVHTIMLARLDMAVQKGCNGVDPDNMDGYNNDNGLQLTQQDSIDYMTFLAGAAHQRGLSIGLKNAGEIVIEVVSTVQWSVNEACAQYDECTTFDTFVQNAKPVFHVEYPKGPDVNNNIAISTSKKNAICTATAATKFSTIIKNSNLDGWIEVC